MGTDSSSEAKAIPRAAKKGTQMVPASPVDEASDSAVAARGLETLSL